MKFLKHLLNNPFILATGMAALAHSTWALCTLFSGNEPTQFTGSWWAWLIPGLLIAFALDVGQIATSTEIRGGQRKPIKYVTFGVFSVATYYLQWLYISHHMPSVSLGDGVRAEWVGFASLFRDMGIWIIPALLPLSTMLYTLSESDEKEEPKPEESSHQPRIVIVDYKDDPTPKEIAIPGIENIALPGTVSEVQTALQFTCPDCGKSMGPYKDARSMAQAERVHKRYCTTVKTDVSVDTLEAVQS